MVKQIELFSPDDPFVKDYLEQSKVYTGPNVIDNETGELMYVHLDKKYFVK